MPKRNTIKINKTKSLKNKRPIWKNPVLITLFVAFIIAGGFVGVQKSHAYYLGYKDGLNCPVWSDDSEYPYLSYGSTGPCVASMQFILTNKWGISTQGIDRVFGPNTRNAVILFQTYRHIKADGIVGPLTWHNLHCGIPGTNTAFYTPSQCGHTLSAYTVYLPHTNNTN